MRKDITAKEYLSDKARIADLINGAVFGGKQMVHPEDIKEMGDQLHYISEVEGGEIETRHHDLIYKIIVGTDTFLFGIQNQSAVDPLMPLRIAEYVVMQYKKEAKEIMRNHRRERNLKGDEYISGFSRKDRLKPVVIIVLFFGEGEWDGARRMWELLEWSDVSAGVQSLFMDWNINLIEINKYDHADCFFTDLRLVFGFLKRRKEKEKLKKFLEENKKGFSNLEISAYHLIQEVCGIKNADRIRKMRTENGQEVIDMCQAIDDLIFEGKAEGKAEAIAETVIAMIRTKINRGEDVWHIADALELGINEVEPLYKLLQKYPGEENLQIAKRYMKLTM